MSRISGSYVNCFEECRGRSWGPRVGASQGPKSLNRGWKCFVSVDLDGVLDGICRIMHPRVSTRDASSGGLTYDSTPAAIIRKDRLIHKEGKKKPKTENAPSTV